MEYQKLESFVNAAYHLNFTKAAKISHITQATMSRHIKSLEDEIGAPLFIRTQYGVKLTSAGKYLYNRVVSHLDHYRDIIEGCKNSLVMPFSKLRIVGGPYEHLLVYQMLKTLLERFPFAQYNYMSYTYKIISSRYENKSIDFSFTTETCAILTGGLRYTPIFEGPWEVVAHKDSPFWKLPEQARKTFEGQRIVTMYRGDFEPVEAYCINQSFRPSEFIESNFLDPQLLLLRTSNCIAILPPFVRSVLPNDLRMENILDVPLNPKFVAAYDPENTNEGCSYFFDICKENSAVTSSGL